MNRFTIQSEITREDFYKAGIWISFYKNKTTNLMASGFILVFLIFIDIMTLLSSEPDVTQIVVFTIAIILYPFLVLYAQRAMIRYKYDVETDFPKQVTYTFLDQSIEEEIEDMRMEYLYSLVTVIKEMKSILCLFMDKKDPIIIHKADLKDNEWNAFKTFLGTKIDSQKLKWKN
ncbi:MAG: YcxB family protein [Bacilli bacterium]|nr:YcxB family protein [Bacilli bacterium]MBN2876579.1 YcxB family protein [Bacilli bacterium]